jgi:hypothetical protein
MLKPGDHVLVRGEDLRGTVVAARPHEVEVRVLVDGGEQHRRYPYESVELVPTLDEASKYVDH